jgi:hypothetical protein
VEFHRFSSDIDCIETCSSFTDYEHYLAFAADIAVAIAATE